MVLALAAVMSTCFVGPASLRGVAPTPLLRGVAPTPLHATMGATSTGTAVDGATDTVEGALVKLFNSYDTTRKGYITLDEFTSAWVAGREYADHNTWESRQARAGARRIRRLFQCEGPTGCLVDVTKETFVGIFGDYYAKRLEHGALASSTAAISEILCNIPQRALFAEMYGSE
jgi:hypothetical protein